MKIRFYSPLCTVATALLLFSQAKAEPIVMIGDSITCGPFGERMLKNLEQGGKNSITQYCMVGSAPSHWIQGRKAVSPCQRRVSPSIQLKACTSPAPTLNSILDANKNAHIVVALGTNSMVGPKIDSSYKLMAEKIASVHHSCDWILPPNMNASQSKGWKPGHVRDMQNRLSSISNQIKSAVNNGTSTHCLPIDSRAATAQGTKGFQTIDGVHRTKEAGYDWADAIKGDLMHSNASDAPTSTQNSRNRSGR